MREYGPIQPTIKVAKPHSFGWLRRSELESANYPHIHVWEKPNGEIHNHDARQGALLLYVYLNNQGTT